MWLRFTDSFDYRKPAWTIAYKAGMVENVTAECATLAVAAGKAVRLRKASKDSEPVEDSDAVGDTPIEESAPDA